MKMILPTGIKFFRTKNRSSIGFTFLEIMAVMVLMTAVISMAIGYLSSSSRALKKSAFMMSRDIQSIYQKATKDAEFQRLLLNEDRHSYQLQKFEPPQPKPLEDDSDPNNRKKIEEWETAQKEFENTNKLERSELTRLQRGGFKTFKTQTLPGEIHVKTFLTARGIDKEKRDDKEPAFIMFFPSGETDQTLITLDDGNEHFFSLTINPLSGRVSATQGEITEQEWKKSIKGE
jgi:type II secretory pathway pseudopilin PulG